MERPTFDGHVGMNAFELDTHRGCQPVPLARGALQPFAAPDVHAAISRHGGLKAAKLLPRESQLYCQNPGVLKGVLKESGLRQTDSGKHRKYERRSQLHSELLYVTKGFWFAAISAAHLSPPGIPHQAYWHPALVLFYTSDSDARS